jgi:hypothetical protein
MSATPQLSRLHASTAVRSASSGTRHRASVAADQGSILVDHGSLAPALMTVTWRRGTARSRRISARVMALRRPRSYARGCSGALLRKGCSG